MKIGDLVVVRPGTDDPRLPDNRMGVIILGLRERRREPRRWHTERAQQKAKAYEITEGGGFDLAKIFFSNGEILMFHTDYLTVVDKK